MTCTLIEKNIVYIRSIVLGMEGTESGDLFMNPTADAKALFLWHEVLVLVDRSLGDNLRETTQNNIHQHTKAAIWGAILNLTLVSGKKANNLNNRNNLKPDALTITHLHKHKETLLPALPNILPKSPQIPVKTLSTYKETKPSPRHNDNKHWLVHIPGAEKVHYMREFFFGFAIEMRKGQSHSFEKKHNGFIN